MGKAWKQSICKVLCWVNNTPSHPLPRLMGWWPCRRICVLSGADEGWRALSRKAARVAWTHTHAWRSPGTHCPWGCISNTARTHSATPQRCLHITDGHVGCLAYNLPLVLTVWDSKDYSHCTLSFAAWEGEKKPLKNYFVYLLISRILDHVGILQNIRLSLGPGTPQNGYSFTWQVGKLKLVFLEYTKITIPLNWNNHKLDSKLRGSRDPRPHPCTHLCILST